MMSRFFSRESTKIIILYIHVQPRVLTNNIHFSALYVADVLAYILGPVTGYYFMFLNFFKNLLAFRVIKDIFCNQIFHVDSQLT